MLNNMHTQYGSWLDKCPPCHFHLWFHPAAVPFMHFERIFTGCVSSEGSLSSLSASLRNATHPG